MRPPMRSQDQRRDRKLRLALAPSRFAIALENTVPIWFAICTTGSVPGPPSQIRSVFTRGGGIIAEDLRATGGEPRHGSAIRRFGHRARGQPVHRRRVMVRQVVVERA
jgi:hypothetical protein